MGSIGHELAHVPFGSLLIGERMLDLRKHDVDRAGQQSHFGTGVFFGDTLG